MTPGQLLEESRQLAAGMAARYPPGTRVILVEPDERAFLVSFMGCLLAGLLPAPAAPPIPTRLDRAMPRLRAIAANAGAEALLTSGALADAARAIFPGPGGPRVTTPEEAVTWAASPQGWEPPQIDPGDPAYLQYTSGSTAAPRGVIVTHRNVLAYLPAMLDVSERDMDWPAVLVNWIPLFHDMGLITALFTALYGGHQSVIMSPLTFLYRPLTWLEAIDRYRGTGAAAPNFAYDLCVARTSPEERADLDLRSWRAAWNGAEPIRADTIRAFTEAFAVAGFPADAMRPCYGLAEAVLTVSTGDAHTPPIHHVDLDRLRQGDYRRVAPATPGSREVVPCGRPIPGQRVEIVNPDTHLLVREGAVGEIWIASPMIAAGYWNETETEQGSFGARLADAQDSDEFLRTGDLAAMVDGQLCIVGRVKDMIIVRGENYFPVDIERAAEHAHPQVRAGCVVAATIGILGEEELLVVAEVNATEPAALQDVVRAIRREVASECGLVVQRLALVPPRAVQKTSSGKLRRGATRDAYAASELGVLAGWPAAEEA
ncbi:MAG: hypothetical protein QOK05_1484 [Chloroflexota bacterium]|nr:hypothetical protein [Chloroflexota bacterium]